VAISSGLIFSFFFAISGVLSAAVKRLIDLGLCVKFTATNGDRLRLWDDVSQQDRLVLTTKVFDQNAATRDAFLLDTLILMETLAPQTHFYDIFSVQKRETAAHTRKLVEVCLGRSVEADCSDAFKLHLLESQDFGVFLCAVIVLSSVDSSWTKIPADEVLNMETKLKLCQDIVARANEKGMRCSLRHPHRSCANSLQRADLFDSRRLRFHIDIASAWKSRIIGNTEDAIKFGEQAAASALEFNASAAPDAPSFSIIDIIEFSHAELLCVCLEPDLDVAASRTQKLLALAESTIDSAHPAEYLRRVVRASTFSNPKAQ
jgi:hypothetical protein